MTMPPSPPAPNYDHRATALEVLTSAPLPTPPLGTLQWVDGRAGGHAAPVGRVRREHEARERAAR